MCTSESQETLVKIGRIQILLIKTDLSALRTATGLRVITCVKSVHSRAHHYPDWSHGTSLPRPCTCSRTSQPSECAVASAFKSAFQNAFKSAVQSAFQSAFKSAISMCIHLHCCVLTHSMIKVRLDVASAQILRDLLALIPKCAVHDYTTFLESAEW